MSIGYFISYIIGFSIITNLVLAQNPPKLIILALIICFVAGWFVIIGMAITHEATKSFKEAVKSGPKEGVKLLRNWSAYILGMVAISGVVYLLFIWPHQ
jgi:hypothetical protein